MKEAINLPLVENYNALLPVAKKLYTHTNHLAWQMLLPLFLLSCLMAYSYELGITGAIVKKLKKLVIVCLLLVAFPTIADTVQVIGVEIAKSIDDMTGVDFVLEAAKKRSQIYSLDIQGLFNLGNDFAMGILVLASFIILVFARYALLAFQHFYWLLLLVLGPLLILGNLFDASENSTRNLFKNMIQVACWPIIWAILSAFLKVIPFADAYQTEGGYATIITLNLIIAIALLLSPFIVSHLTDGSISSLGSSVKSKVTQIGTSGMSKVYSAARDTHQVLTHPQRNFKK